MPIATRDDIYDRIVTGKTQYGFANAVASTTTTSAVAASGFISLQLSGNAIGGTFPTTLPSLQGITTTDDLMHLMSMSGSSITSRGSGLLRAYLIGTLNLAATGDQFTHNAATFPVTRTQFGASAQPVHLIPVIQVTTALTTTAAVVRLRTAGGAAGYVNQAGTSVVGTKSFTFPSATTATGSCFTFMLEDNDYSIRDITAIEVTTASATGAANIWGVELVSSQQNYVVAPTQYDPLYSAVFAPLDIRPAIATSGTATSILAPYNLAVSVWTNTSFNAAVRP